MEIHRPAVDDLELLRLERDALWVTDARGRLRHERTPERRPAPLLAVAACPLGVDWAASVEVPAPVVDHIAELLARERPDPSVGWVPATADRLLDALGRVRSAGPPHGGPSYVVPALTARTGSDLRTSREQNVDSLRGLMPEEDRSLSAPWVVAMVGDEVAAVCETARSATRSVEAGVWTYEPFRRRGLAAAVVAAWSELVGDRTAFYSTSWDNIASQGVASRLALRPLGHWWQVGRA